MKAGISNIWLLGMIATFIFLFSCYVIISVNYTKSFKMKNEILSIIERSKGMTIGKGTGSGVSVFSAGKSCTSAFGLGEVTCDVPAYQTINLYLLGNSYTATGYCNHEDGVWYGVKNLETVSWEVAKNDTKYYYCFAKYKFGNNNIRRSGSGKSDLSTVTADRYVNYYYKVRLFYIMELPVLNNWLSVKVEGETSPIWDVQDGDKWTPNNDIGYKNG